MPAPPIRVSITDENETGEKVVAAFDQTPQRAFIADPAVSMHGISVRDFAEAVPNDTADPGHEGLVQMAMRQDAPSALAGDDEAFNFVRMDGKGRAWVAGAHTMTVKRSDTFTAVGNGTTVDFAFAPFKSYGLQVKQTGVVTSWTVLVQLSMDSTNWTSVVSHTNLTPGDGLMIWPGLAAISYPAAFGRARCSAITLGAGTNVVATWIACP